MNKWTRRTFIATGSLVGGGLALGIAGIAFAPNRLGVKPDENAGTPQLNTWIKIAPDDTVTVIVPHCEMGQGAQTALAMMLAEELDADWNLVRVEEAPSLDEYANGYIVRVFVPPVTNVPPPSITKNNSACLSCVTAFCGMFTRCSRSTLYGAS